MRNESLSHDTKISFMLQFHRYTLVWLAMLTATYTIRFEIGNQLVTCMQKVNRHEETNRFIATLGRGRIWKSSITGKKTANVTECSSGIMHFETPSSSAQGVEEFTASEVESDGASLTGIKGNALLQVGKFIQPSHIWLHPR